MISSQYGTVFEDKHYEKLRKVYSIWICPKPAKKAANKIKRYSATEKLLEGDTDPLPKETYDLMEVVILNLATGGEQAGLENRDGNNILRLLSVLFSTEISPTKKKDILQNEYHIAMEEKIERSVNDMCNLSQMVWEEGHAAGRSETQDEIRAAGFTEGHASGVIEGRADAYLNAMKRMQETLKMTAEQAMDILGIPKAEQDAYLNL